MTVAWPVDRRQHRINWRGWQVRGAFRAAAPFQHPNRPSLSRGGSFVVTLLRLAESRSALQVSAHLRRLHPATLTGTDW